MLEYRSDGTCGAFAYLYVLGYTLYDRMPLQYNGRYGYIVVEFYSFYSRSISRIISKDLLSIIKNGLCYIRTIIYFFFLLIQVVLPTSSRPGHIRPLGEFLVLGACSRCRIVAGVRINMAG